MNNILFNYNLSPITKDIINKKTCLPLKYLDSVKFKFYKQEDKKIIENNLVEDKGMFICGPAGTGKTCLVTQIVLSKLFGNIESYSNIDIPMVFFITGSSLSQINNSFQYEIIKNILIKTKYLILDDFAIITQSNKIDTYIDCLIRERYHNNLITYYTSNLLLSDLKDKIGSSLHSIIYETTTILTLPYENKRFKK